MLTSRISHQILNLLFLKAVKSISSKLEVIVNESLVCGYNESRSTFDKFQMASESEADITK